MFDKPYALWILDLEINKPHPMYFTAHTEKSANICTSVTGDPSFQYASTNVCLIVFLKTEVMPNFMAISKKKRQKDGLCTYSVTLRGDRVNTFAVAEQ